MFILRGAPFRQPSSYTTGSTERLEMTWRVLIAPPEPQSSGSRRRAKRGRAELRATATKQAARKRAPELYHKVWV